MKINKTVDAYTILLLLLCKQLDMCHIEISLYAIHLIIHGIWILKSHLSAEFIKRNLFYHRKIK